MPTRRQTLANKRNYQQMAIKGMKTILTRLVSEYWGIDVRPALRELDEISLQIDERWEEERKKEKK